MEFSVEFLAGLFTAIGLIFAYFVSRYANESEEVKEPYESRDFIALDDLIDPRIRGDHLSFNRHLHKRFGGQRFIPVHGEKGCYLAIKYATVKEAMNDHQTFSSNPFAEDRLVALNTMSKADHSRVLKYVHSHYNQENIGSLEDRIRQVIERCTDELESGVAGFDAATWAKRIHMASTLARLGVDWLGEAGSTPEQKQAAWSRVDEVIYLNDAMVALVAPLGGVGKRYRSLPLLYPLWVFIGLLQSLPGTLTMAYKFGLRCTWEIIRPDVTVLFPPARPRTGLWWCPELLPLVPRYFLALYDLLHSPSAEEGPLAGIKKGVQEGKLKLAEALTLIVQLMVNMTSANALANMVYRLATEEEAVEQVKADPEGLSTAFVLETLRLDAPLQRNPRRVVKAMAGKWKDAPMQEGDQVLLLLGAANMDPAVYEEPHLFRLGRAMGPGESVPSSFGSGMHYCLGSNLVKLEMKVALQCLLRRYSSVELKGTHKRLDDIDVGNWGFRSLPVKVNKKT